MSDEAVKAAASMTNAEAIEGIVDLLKQYKQCCKLLRKNPDGVYDIAVIKAVSCIGFADGFKRAYQEAGNGAKQE